MRWPRLVGRPRNKPPKGVWHEWKQEIADHCLGQCVYCAIHESRYGGIRNYHIEHYRPKSKFKAHENRIENLFLACSICNVLKSDDWPAEPTNDHSVASYPNPALVDYNELFRLIAQDSYKLTADSVAGRYLIERMLLNRGQLQIERRWYLAMDWADEFFQWADSVNQKLIPDEFRELVPIMAELGRVQLGTTRARPYRDIEAKRPEPLTKTKAKK